MRYLSMILPLLLGLALNGDVYAAGCDAACYARIKAQKAQQLQASRQRAQAAHARAMTQQQARRAAALQRQRQAQAIARHSQPHRVPARPVYRPPQQARRAVPRPAYRARNVRLTPQQQLQLMQALQQQQAVYNMVSRSYQNTMNGMNFRLNVFNAQQACAVAGNCRIEVRRYYR
ncbi:MAG: hypothetical protein KDI44_08880 [Thiothrix sp.]|nr:hypothetical protein [Thiothrix sp.]HPQ95681.1 hypothetical protein [Thiolinea sp.]